MAVTLPSDLIMDVIRNAEPARQAAAAGRLKAAAGSSAGLFAWQMNRIDVRPGEERGTSQAADQGAKALLASRDAAQSEKPALRGFEQMVLRNLFETLLPPEESGSFGSGPSAGVWRSLAADQLANVYADAGGIGIARLLSRHGADAGLRPDAQWPYFTMKTIRGHPV